MQPSSFVLLFSSLDTEEVNSYQSEPETVQQTIISPTPLPMISMVELFNQRQEKLEKRRLRIAGLSNRILENPQEHVSHY